MVYENVWTSITVLCNSLIETARLDHPSADIRYIDWENSNTDELPDADLIGPTAIAVEDYGLDEIGVNFAIAVSTYTNDTNLFRQRQILSKIHSRLRPEAQFSYLDRQRLTGTSVFVVTPGGLISPMTRMNVRPWQYVQVAALLMPEGS